MKVITSRDFNQDVSHAKRAARLEPVFITDRGKPTHVLVAIEEWRRLRGESESLVDLLAMPDGPDFDPAGARSAGAWGRGD
ncbi:MAG: prevent-host-death family protein [Alphaproteobacteria bacterium]|nr:prevent-host-death family protein [Alphaproteobacteria bacterium]